MGLEAYNALRVENRTHLLDFQGNSFIRPERITDIPKDYDQETLSAFVHSGRALDNRTILVVMQRESKG